MTNSQRTNAEYEACGSVFGWKVHASYEYEDELCKTVCEII